MNGVPAFTPWKQGGAKRVSVIYEATQPQNPPSGKKPSTSNSGSLEESSSESTLAGNSTVYTIPGETLVKELSFLSVNVGTSGAGIVSKIGAAVPLGGYTPMTADYVASILNKRNDSNEVNYPGYPSDPKDIDLRALGLANDAGLTKDYFWNPVSGNGIIRNEGTIHETATPTSDKRYFYYKESDQTSSDIADDSSRWMEVDPVTVSEQTVSDFKSLLQSEGSVLVFNKNLGNAVTKDDLYNAITKNGNTNGLNLKQIHTELPTIYLSGLLVGDLRFTQDPNDPTSGGVSTAVSENSYIRLDGSNSTLIFQKTENDRLYNELSVNIFVAGAVDFSGLKNIVVNDNVLINKSSSYLANTGDRNAPTIVFGAPISGGAGKHIYIESTHLILSAESSDYEGDWYFGYGSNILFAIHNAQSSNPFGTGKLVARQSAWTFGDDTPDRLKENNVFTTLGNAIVIDGDPDRGRGNRDLTVHESSHERYYNEISGKYNRIYRILNGGISDGDRGTAALTWGERNNDNLKNESWIFSGDNSKFGLFKGWAGRDNPANFNEKGYATSKEFYSWNLGTSDYNMERLGGTTALPLIFGSSSEFKYGENYAAIAGYGAFIYKGLGTDYTNVGFDFDSNVEVGNAFFGNIRYVSLGDGVTKLTNTANELNAGVWILAGGTIEVSDIKALGTGALNILDGTLRYTGTQDASFAGEVGNKNSAFNMNNALYSDSKAGTWAIDVANAGTTLSMDATKTSNFDKIEVNTRNNDFTKLGAGTLKITAGKLINPTTNNYVGSVSQNQSASVYLKAGILQMTGTAELGSIKTLYMEGGSFISEKNLSLTKDYTVEKAEDGRLIYKNVNTGNQLYCQTDIDLTADNFSAYNKTMQDVGFSGVIGLKYEYNASYGYNLTKFTYGGTELYYKDSDGKWVIVGREKNTTGTGGAYINTTNPAKLAEQLKKSYLGNNGTGGVSDFNGKDIDPSKLLVIDGNNGVKTDITSWGDPSSLTGTTIVSDTSKILTPVGQKLNTNTDGSFTLVSNSEAETNLQLNSLGAFSRSIHMAAMKDPNFVHEITVGNNGSGTLNLNGGTLTYEFTYFTPLADPTKVERPSHTSLKINGSFTVGELGGSVLFEFTNGALVQKGFYKLLETSTDISLSDIAKLTILGLGNTSNSRQTITLLRGDQIKGMPLDETVSIPSGTGKDLYVYIEPSSTILHWNTTSNVWEQHNKDNEELAKNWYSFDPSVTDTNFYENDSVYFCDQNHESTQGGSTERTHHIEIRGEVAPLHIVVNSNLENYVFEGTGSITGTGRLKKTGEGTLTIKTSNTFSGGADISAGTVNALATHALGTGTIKVYENGILNVGATSATDTEIVDNVLYGNLELDVEGTVNIFGKNALAKEAKINVSGGTLKAYAQDSIGAAKLNASGGKIYAMTSGSFNGNEITLESNVAGKNVDFFANATNALGTSTINVRSNSKLHANAASIGTGAIITLSGDVTSLNTNGTLVIGADNALNGLSSVNFYRGGTVTVADSVTSPDKRDFDISGFTTWNWLAFASGGGVVFDIAEKGSSLTVSGTKLIDEETYNIRKQGAGTLIFKTTAGVEYKGSISFEGTTREESGEIVINFGEGLTPETSAKFSGKLTGDGTIRFVGIHGDRDDASSATMNAFKGLRIFNLSEQLCIYETAVYMTVENIKKIVYSTEFASGEIHLNAQSVKDTAYRVGAIHTSESIDRENVKVLAEGAHGTFVVTQNGEDGIFHGKFIDNIGGSETQGDLTMSVIKYGDHLLTLANDNTTTGTLKVENGAVQIGTGTGTLGDWAGLIDLRNENTEIVYSYGAGETKIIGDNTRIEGNGTVKIASGNVQFGNDYSFMPSVRINIAKDAGLTTNFSSPKTGQIQSAISGNGHLTVKGGGLMLGGENTFSGGTSIMGSTEATAESTRVIAMKKTAFGAGSVVLNGKSDIIVETTAAGLTLSVGQTISVANDWTGILMFNGISLENVIGNPNAKRADTATAYISGNTVGGSVLNLANSATGTLIFDLSGITLDTLLSNANANNVVGIYIASSNLGLANWDDLQSIACAGDGTFSRGNEVINGYAGTTQLVGGNYIHTYDDENGILYISIPEPSAFSLFAGTFMLAFVITRRKRKK